MLSDLELSHHESQIAIIPEIRGEDCDPFTVICGKYFSLFYILIFLMA